VVEVTDTPEAASNRVDADEVVLRLADVHKIYGKGDAATTVLHDINMEFKRGDFAALIGPSGSGKSTLLNILGLLDRPSAGRLEVDGIDASTLDDDERTALRGRTLGFIFQFHHLLPAFSVLENVLMPVRIERRPTAADTAFAKELLSEVGLSDQAHKKADQISGGQAQRVAIARALCMKPAVILADEPTGNLDTESSDQSFALMQEAHRVHGCAFLIVTHDPRIAGRCRRVVKMVDGRIVADDLQTAEEKSQASPGDAEERIS